MPSCDSYKGSPRALKVKESMSGSRKAFREKERWSVAKIWSAMHKQIFDATGIVKRQIRKALGIDGERLIRALELSAGGTAKGDVEFQIANNKIYRGLTKDQEEHLNELIQARRNIGIENNRKSIARSLTDDKALGTVFDMQNPEHVAILEKMYEGKKFEQKLDYRYMTVRKTTKDPRSDTVKTKWFKDEAVAEAFAKKEIDDMLEEAKILNPDGLTKADYDEFIAHFKEESPTEYRMLKKRADLYFRVMKSQLGHMRRAGLITETLFNSMAKVEDYSPRRYIQFFDPDITFNNMVPLTTGSTQALQQDSALLMRDYMVRLHDRIARNEANIELYKYAEKFPNNPIIKIVNPDDDTKGSEVKIKGKIKGKAVAVTMPHELGVEWGKIDAAIDRETANILQAISLSTWVRAGATGFNPGFAVTNFPRDIFFSWFRTREYSKFFPRALFQMAKHFAKTFKSVWHRGDTPIGEAKDFLDDGGMLEFMTAEGIPDKLRAGHFRVIHPGLRWLSKYASFLGQKTELWVRVALRDRALENRLKTGVSMEEARKEATWIARGYLDFSQGGKMIKMADKALPYLNAGIQATRGMFATLLKGEVAGGDNPNSAQRAENLAVAWAKFMQFFMIAGAVFLNNLLDHPEKVLKVPKRDMGKNLVFFLEDMDKTDKHGNIQHAYLNIALDQGQAGINGMAGLMLTQFLAATYGTEGDTVLHKLANVNPEVFHDAIKNLIPFSNFVPPSLKILLGMNNIDSYRLSNVSHKGEMDDNGQEYLPWTHPAFIASAEELNKWWPDTAGLVKGKPFSPQRLRLVWDTLFTPSNSFVKFFNMMSTKKLISMIGTPDEQEARLDFTEDIQRQMANIPFFSRFVKYTPAESVEDRDIARKTSEHLNSANWKIRNKVNFWTDSINKVDTGNPKTDKARVDKWARAGADQLDKFFEDGLIKEKADLAKHKERLWKARGIKNTFGFISTPKLFKDLAIERSGAARAGVFFSVWEQASPKHRTELENNLKIVKTVGDKTTINYLTPMLREYKKNEGNK